MNIKRMMWVIVAILLVLIAIILIKTYMYPFSKEAFDPATQTATEFSPVKPQLSEASIRRFAGGIRIPTVSTEVYEETNFAPFDTIKAYMPEVYPAVYEAMDTLTVNKYGLVFHWKGKDPARKPILFLSHYDVVPVLGHDPVTQESVGEEIFRPADPAKGPVTTHSTAWDYPPFSGAVADGRLYGRGTLDMKGMLFALLEAADALIGEGFVPEQDIWFAFGHDEEVGGRQGALQIAQYFKEQGLTFDAVYDEGGIIAAPESLLKEVDQPMAVVGVGEKGFLTVRLKIKGEGGHSSMPPQRSTLVMAAEIIEKLNTNQMPEHLIPPMEHFLDNIGGKMNFIARVAIANQWLLERELLRTLAKNPASNALIRTTTDITMAKGSDAANVLSSVAEVTVNFRILPGETVEDVMQHVQQQCKGYDVEIEQVSVREPSGISPEDTRGFQVIGETIGTLYPGTIVTPYITVGGTDAYKYQIVSDRIYRLMPVYVNDYEVKTIHNENEHIELDNWARMIWYFREVMKTF
ncbi:MAG: M20/M25/M40 family metallo-hydrolase [Bacteroides sp.]|nr:M20/M25/M40 family metallo-hydrolase [Bacteroides sp.]